MNIVVVSPGVSCEETMYGFSYVAEQARALHRLGNKVVMVTISQQWIKGYRITDAVSPEGIEIIRVQCPIVRYTWYFPSVIGFMFALRRIKKVFKIDVIHAHLTLPTGVVALISGKLKGIPVVITEHNGPIRDLCSGRISSAAMKYAARKADALILVSDHLMEEAKEILQGSDRWHVIPNLFNPEVFHFNDRNVRPESVINVLFVSRGHDERKCNRLAIEGFAKAVKVCKLPLRLIVAGPNLENELRPVVQNQAIEDLCRFTGSVSSNKLAQLMRSCDFLVVTSDYETFSLVLIEAMASGMPVITTKCGGPEEIVTSQSGKLIPKGDLSALAKAISEMANQINQYDRQSISNQTFARYKYDVVIPRIMRVYETVIGK
ncbi:MAG: glycosyltransferase [Acidobacteriota bacterium]|nr:glycosyltransferase [Acidobacteriota bacterium]